MTPIVDPFDDTPAPSGVVDPFDDAPTTAPAKQSRPKMRTLPAQAWRDLQLTGRMGLEGFGLGPIADYAGMASPENPLERNLNAVGRNVAMTTGMAGLAGKVAPMVSGASKEVMKLLAANPKLQMMLSALSGSAAQMTKESGAGEGAQLAAAIGVPVAATVGGRAMGSGVRTLKDMIMATSGSGARRAGGRVAADVLGPRAPAAVQALRQGAAPETAAQAAVPAGSAEFSGLEHLVRGRRPSEFNPAGVIPKEAANWTATQRSGLNASMDPVRTQILASADNVGMDVADLSMEVARLKSTPGFKDKTSTYILNWVDKELVRRADPNTAGIAGVDLYGLRKDLGTEIKKRAADATKPWDKQMGVKLLTEIQKSIDHTIERATGNTKWTDDYMVPYSKKAAEIGAVGQRAADSEVMGAAGRGRAGAIARTDEVPITLPNLLSRPIMAINAVLHRLQGYGGEKTSMELANLMQPQNKAILADLIEKELKGRAGRLTLKDLMAQAARTSTAAHTGQAAFNE